MDIKRLEALFEAYPKLPNFITAGTISLKAARNILGIDKWAMEDVFYELLDIGAINGAGPASWRAKDELRKYLKDRNI